MNDLPTWLRVQIAEDRRAAQAATPGPWGIMNSEIWSIGQFDATQNPIFYGATVVEEVGEESNPAVQANAEHIASWDPVRVLAECDAKEQIIEDHAPVVDGTQSSWTWFQGSESKSERILCLLALPYSARPGYQEEWKP